MDLAVQANAMQSKSINMTSLARSKQGTGIFQKNCLLPFSKKERSLMTSHIRVGRGGPR